MSTPDDLHSSRRQAPEKTTVPGDGSTPNHGSGLDAGRRPESRTHGCRPVTAGWAFVFCVFLLLAGISASLAKDQSLKPSIDTFIDRYFSSWSERDMDSYKDCFHQKATIVLLDRANAPRTSLALDDFIRLQGEAHRKSIVRMREVSLNRRITVTGNVAQATVRWRLSKGSRTVTGVDLFTLVLISGQWKILHLTARSD